MGSAPPAGRGFSPLDEELGLLPGSLTPSLVEDMVRLGSWMPPDAIGVAKLIGHFRKVAVSSATVRRATENTKKKPAQAAKLPSAGQRPPAANHPWRRMAVGRSASPKPPRLSSAKLWRTPGAGNGRCPLSPRPVKGFLSSRERCTSLNLLKIVSSSAPNLLKLLYQHASRRFST